jgi:tRNA pseudouridine55 synthase
MAQGLLILLVGSATRVQHAFQSHDKTYETVLRLGLQTDTGDAAGRPVRTAAVPALERRQVEELFASLIGPVSQTPPTYSAVKVHGRPAYWWARRRRPIALPARTIQILGLELLAMHAETITFRVRCSAGTYVRSLVEFMAERLGTTGHVAGLVRVRVGPWRIEEALPLSWVAAASREELIRQLRPVPPPPRPEILSVRRTSGAS